ncbi:MAG: hypothetical protein E7F16_16990, partial [Enterococcus casseliflavus]|nr:hypothetical protein [Enterococcus casseliflavus]
FPLKGFIVIPPAIFFYYSTLFDSRFKTLQQNQLNSHKKHLNQNIYKLGKDNRLLLKIIFIPE